MLIFAAVVIVGVVAWRLLPKKQPLLAPKIENSIAVITFENQTGDQGYDYLQKAIPNLLITNLERTGELYVATWERMHDLIKQMGQKDVENIDRDLGFEICRREGIESIVTGSFVKAGDTFVTDVKVLMWKRKNSLKERMSKEGAKIAFFRPRSMSLQERSHRDWALQEKNWRPPSKELLMSRLLPWKPTIIS